jgi:hypothetical protein
MVVVVVVIAEAAATTVCVDQETITARHSIDELAQDCGTRGVATTHPENISKVQSHSKLLEMLYVFSLYV